MTMKLGVKTKMEEERPWWADRTQEDLARAQQEINENPEDVEIHLGNLKLWVSSQPYFKLCSGAGETRLYRRILRRCKYDYSKAINMIETITFDLANPLSQPFLLRRRDGLKDHHVDIIKSGMFTILPRRTREGCRVLMHRIGLWDPARFSFANVVQVLTLLCEINKQDDTPVLEGVQRVHDLQGLSIAHIRAFPIASLHVLARLEQNLSNERVRGVHLVNTSPVSGTLLDLVRTFQSKKMKSRTHVNSRNLDSLLEHVDKEVLPLEYGGLAGPVADIHEKYVDHVFTNMHVLEHVFELHESAFYADSDT